MGEGRESTHELHVAFRGLDLNLLVTLDALLEARSVTDTAQRFGVTQSAMSHRLARLREFFEDPLLVSAGDTLTLTPKAELVRQPLRAALTGLRGAVLPDDEFQPETSTRTFVIASSDLLEVSLLPFLLRHLDQAAPGVGLRMAGRGLVRGDALISGKVDLAIAPGEGTIPGVGIEVTSGIRQRKLVTEGFSVLVRRGHPRVSEALTIEDYLRENHILVAPQGQPGGLVDARLAKEGLARRVSVQVAHFLSAPLLVARTDALLTCPSGLAEATQEFFDLRALEPPLELPRTAIFMYWHERVHRDPAHRWFREEICALVERDRPEPR